MGDSGKEGILIHGTISTPAGWKPFVFLIDTGCTKSCVAERNAKRLGLQMRRLRHHQYAGLADVSLSKQSYEAIIHFRFGSYSDRLHIDISGGRLDPEDGLLGMDWLLKTNPRICFHPLSFKINHKGKSYEVLGMRPPGKPKYCEDHGYAHDKSRNSGQKTQPGHRGGHHGHHHSGGWNKMPYYYRHKAEAGAKSTANTDGKEPEDDKKQWTDWRVLFPDRDWYDDSNPMKQEKAVRVVAKQHKRNAKPASTTSSNLTKAARATEGTTPIGQSLSPRTITDAEGFLSIKKIKSTPATYELFR